MKTIQIVDPVTRIEGHMKVEITIDAVGGANQIVDARCTGTLFRGFETLLQGRKPIDATVITQRICGVCPISHGQTAVLALENASGFRPPNNARLLRNLTLGANYIQSHILHFYLLAALDFMAGPAAAPWSSAWDVDLRDGLGDVAAHFVQAVAARRTAHEMGAVFGGKMPASHTFVTGGFTAVPSQEKIDLFRRRLNELTAFVQNIYIPDVQRVGEVYPDYFKVGAGCRNLMAFGVFEEDNDGFARLFRPGYAEDGATVVLDTFDSGDITEAVAYSWYADGGGGRSPLQGVTQPAYPKGDAYSWLKAPRLFNRPFEVGPLARMWVQGLYQKGISVMDRHLARAREALVVAQAMQRWLGELDNGPVHDETYDQRSGVGIGLAEAPRGALGHWVEVRDGKIAHYQIITPTCWNASPRDGQGTPGPLEQALIGTPVADPARPVEALRVIHAFDPCLSCAVHLMRPEGPAQVVWTGAC